MDPELLRGLPTHVLRDLCASYRLWKEGNPTDARAALERTLTPAARADTPVALLSAHQLLGHIAYEEGDLSKASQHHRYVLHGSRSLNLLVGVASAQHNLGLIAEREGRIAEARLQIGEALRLYLQIGCESGAAAARANLARLG